MRQLIRHFSLLVFILALPLGAKSSSYPESSDLENIRVRVFSDVKTVQIRGLGIRLPEQDELFNSALKPRSILPRQDTLQIQREHNLWVVKGTDGQEISIDPSARTLRILGSFLKVNGESVADEVILVPRKESVQTISVMSLDEYLKGVLPSEMPASWPLETLKAQAIAARSYALSLKHESSMREYDVDDSTNHQVFRMANFLRSNSENQSKIKSAIHETRDIRLVNDRGEPYRTYYHSDCGGHTEEPTHIWGSKTVYGATQDEGCSLSKRNSWAYSIDSLEIEGYVQKKLRLNFKPKLVGFEVLSQSPSGRAIKLKAKLAVKTDTASSSELEHIITGEELRKAFGYNKVRSTLFDMEFVSNKVRIKGRGHGHGIGLCQNGARFMALAGQNAESIIRRYYPYAKLKTAQELLALKARADATRM